MNKVNPELAHQIISRLVLRHRYPLKDHTLCQVSERRSEVTKQAAYA